MPEPSLISLLSTRDFGLLHTAGLRPLTSVTGAARRRQGKPLDLVAEAGDFDLHFACRVPVVDSLWSGTLRAALDDTATAAARHSAGAVFDVDWIHDYWSGEGNLQPRLEVQVTGTAVAGRGSRGRPVLSTLSVTDWQALHSGGWVVGGVANAAACMFVSLSAKTQAARALRRLANHELEIYGAALAMADRLVDRDLLEQGKRLRAAGIVGVRRTQTTLPAAYAVGQLAGVAPKPGHPRSWITLDPEGEEIGAVVSAISHLTRTSKMAGRSGLLMLVQSVGTVIRRAPAASGPSTVPEPDVLPIIRMEPAR